MPTVLNNIGISGDYGQIVFHNDGTNNIIDLSHSNARTTIHDLSVNNTITTGTVIGSGPNHLLELSGNFGINTSGGAPLCVVDISDYGAMKIPVGITGQRPGGGGVSDGSLGMIRYNTTSSTFEGYGPSAWGSLGGVINTEQTTFVNAIDKSNDLSSNSILFTTSAELVAVIDASGQVGIGSTIPQFILDISDSGGLKLPVGSDSQRPGGGAVSDGTVGLIRYNTTSSTFEGYGPSAWGSLGGVINTQQNTFVTALDQTTDLSSNSIQFTTSGELVAVIDASGQVGIGSTIPNVVLDISDSGAISIPSGSTAQRPLNAVNGYIRYNTTTQVFEGYNSAQGGDGWNSLANNELFTRATKLLGGQKLHELDTYSQEKKSQIISMSNDGRRLVYIDSVKDTDGTLSLPLKAHVMDLSTNTGTFQKFQTIDLSGNYGLVDSSFVGLHKVVMSGDKKAIFIATEGSIVDSSANYNIKSFKATDDYTSYTTNILNDISLNSQGGDFSLDIDDAGTTLIVGVSGGDPVRIYDYSSTNNALTFKQSFNSSSLNGDMTNCQYVAMSGNGLSALALDNNNGVNNEQCIAILKRTSIYNDFSKLQTILVTRDPGLSSDYMRGNFSDDGKLLAFGIPKQGSNSNAVRVYCYNDISFGYVASSEFSVITDGTNTLTDASLGDNIVRLSGDGSKIFVSTVDTTNPSNHAKAGAVAVLNVDKQGRVEINSSNQAIASKIYYGERPNEHFGVSIYPNSSGSRVIINSQKNDESNDSNTDAGKVYIYQIDDETMDDGVTLSTTEISSSTGEIKITPASGVVSVQGSGALKVPVGDNNARPPNEKLEAGQIRYNTNNSHFEGYDGNTWSVLSGAEFFTRSGIATAGSSLLDGGSKNVKHNHEEFDKTVTMSSDGHRIAIANGDSLYNSSADMELQILDYDGSSNKVDKVVQNITIDRTPPSTRVDVTENGNIIPDPSYNWDFRVNSSKGYVYDTISGVKATIYGQNKVTTEQDGIELHEGSLPISSVSHTHYIKGDKDQYIDLGENTVRFGGDFSIEFYYEVGTGSGLGNNNKFFDFENSGVVNTYNYTGQQSIFALSNFSGTNYGLTNRDPYDNPKAASAAANMTPSGGLGVSSTDAQHAKGSKVHFVMKWNTTAGNYQIWINGGVNNSGTYSISATASSLNSRIFIKNYLFQQTDAKLFYFRIYPYTLTTNQITSLYNARNTLNVFKYNKQIAYSSVIDYHPNPKWGWDYRRVGVGAPGAGVSEGTYFASEYQYLSTGLWGSGVSATVADGLTNNGSNTGGPGGYGSAAFIPRKSGAMPAGSNPGTNGIGGSNFRGDKTVHSWELYFKVNAYKQYAVLFNILDQDSGNNAIFNLRMNDDNGVNKYVIGYDTTIPSSNGSVGGGIYSPSVTDIEVVPGQWEHIVLVFNGFDTTLFVYQNGVFINSFMTAMASNFPNAVVIGTGTNNDTTVDVAVLGAWYDHSNAPDANMKKFCVWDHALTENHVKALYYARDDKLGARATSLPKYLSSGLRGVKMSNDKNTIVLSKQYPGANHSYDVNNSNYVFTPYVLNGQSTSPYTAGTDLIVNSGKSFDFDNDTTLIVGKSDENYGYDTTDSNGVVQIYDYSSSNRAFTLKQTLKRSDLNGIDNVSHVAISQDGLKALVVDHSATINGALVHPNITMLKRLSTFANFKVLQNISLSTNKKLGKKPKYSFDFRVPSSTGVMCSAGSGIFMRYNADFENNYNDNQPNPNSDTGTGLATVKSRKQYAIANNLTFGGRYTIELYFMPTEIHSTDIEAIYFFNPNAHQNNAYNSTIEVNIAGNSGTHNMRFLNRNSANTANLFAGGNSINMDTAWNPQVGKLYHIVWTTDILSAHTTPQSAFTNPNAYGINGRFGENRLWVNGQLMENEQITGSPGFIQYISRTLTLGAETVTTSPNYGSRNYRFIRVYDGIAMQQNDIDLLYANRDVKYYTLPEKTYPIVNDYLHDNRVQVNLSPEFPPSDPQWTITASQQRSDYGVDKLYTLGGRQYYWLSNGNQNANSEFSSGYDNAFYNHMNTGNNDDMGPYLHYSSSKPFKMTGFGLYSKETTVNGLWSPRHLRVFGSYVPFNGSNFLSDFTEIYENTNLSNASTIQVRRADSDLDISMNYLAGPNNHIPESNQKFYNHYLFIIRETAVSFSGGYHKDYSTASVKFIRLYGVPFTPDERLLRPNLDDKGKVFALGLGDSVKIYSDNDTSFNYIDSSFNAISGFDNSGNQSLGKYKAQISGDGTNLFVSSTDVSGGRGSVAVLKIDKQGKVPVDTTGQATPETVFYGTDISENMGSAIVTNYKGSRVAITSLDTTADSSDNAIIRVYQTETEETIVDDIFSVNEISNTGDRSISIMPSNYKVGINKRVPAFHLDVSGDINISGTINQDGSPYIGSQWTTVNTDEIHYSTGNVGIGTNNPAVKLDVSTTSGGARIMNSNADSDIELRLTAGPSSSSKLLFGTVGPSAGAHKVAIIAKGLNDYARGQLYFCINNTNLSGSTSDSNTASVSDAKMMISASGNVGIGTIHPATKLHILGGDGTHGGKLLIDSDAGHDGGTDGSNSANYNATLHLRSGGEHYTNRAQILFATPNSGTRDYYKAAIIVEGKQTWSRSKMHFCLNDTTGGTANSVSTGPGTETRMLIDSNGNVGIGTTSPLQTFTVNQGSIQIVDSNTPTGSEQNSNKGKIRLLHGTYYSTMNSAYSNSDTFMTNDTAGSALEFGANGSLGWRIDTPPTGYRGSHNNNGSQYLYFYNNYAHGASGASTPIYDVQWQQRAYVSGSSSALMNFTGQHRTFIENISHKDISANNIGLIVSSNKNIYIKMANGIVKGNEAITINESLPLVSKTSKRKDKSVFGVISDAEDHDESSKRKEQTGAWGTVYDKEDGDTRVYINSVGEGAIWVVDASGNLEAGDYITSSNIPGYGELQEDDILHNYTVAKITMDCDFNPALQYKPEIKKKDATDASGNLLRVNDLDENDEIQWVDSTVQEYAYNIRYVDAAGTILTESDYTTKKAAGEAVYKAAFVGCTYHCG